MLDKIKEELEKYKNPERAKHDSRYFKTGKGEYGEGRISLGIETSIKRKLAKEYYQKISLKDIKELLSSGISDYQFFALVILTHKYRKGEQKKEIISLYLENTLYINNWDLVDISAYNILGDFLIEKDKSILYELAKSDNLWERRIAIISTFAFIRNNKFKDTLKISKILLKDKHDLIHKAVGWMLREIGKRDQEVEEDFLKKYYKKMPRTMLRYSIEKFDEDKRKFYLKK